MNSNNNRDNNSSRHVEIALIVVLSLLLLLLLLIKNRKGSYKHQLVGWLLLLQATTAVTSYRKHVGSSKRKMTHARTLTQTTEWKRKGDIKRNELTSQL